MGLKIDKEFEKLLTSLTEKELDSLEESCVKEGIRDPILIWKGIIVDGHNRYKISVKHGLGYETKEMKFKDKDEAKVWIFKNQLARRNMNTYQKIVAALEFAPEISKRAKENRTKGRRGEKIERIGTGEEIAKLAGSSRTYAIQVRTILRKASDEDKKKLENGTTNISAVYQKLPKNPNETRGSKKRVINVKDILDTDDMDKERVEKTINILLHTNQKLKNEMLKMQSFNDVIGQVFRDSVVALPRINPPPVYKHRKHRIPEVAISEISDWHIGEKVVKSEVMGLSHYDVKTFRERLDKLVESIHEVVEIQRHSVMLNKLVINMIGDLVTGENIFIGQGQHIDMPTVDQVTTGANYFATRFVAPMAKLFHEVEIYSIIGGNHARIGSYKQSQAYHKSTNFDKVLVMFLQERCRKLENVKIRLSESGAMIYQIKEAPKFNHLLFHGNEIRSYLGIPYYGIERAHMRYVTMTNLLSHFVHIGHFHEGAELGIPHGERIINGAAVGGDDFSVDKLQKISTPMQKFMGFNNTRGITFRYNLQLDKLPQLKADDNGIFTPYKDLSSTEEIGGELKGGEEEK